MPLSIDAIVPGARTLDGQPAYRVTYSLSPRAGGAVTWKTAIVPEHYRMVEIDWLLRNHWAQDDIRAVSEHVDRMQAAKAGLKYHPVEETSVRDTL